MNMKTLMGFTIIQNELLDESQLTISARYLLMVLIRFSGQDESCYPSQAKLAKILNISARQIRNLLSELIRAGLISKKRSGYNQSNTYTVAKQYRKLTSTQLTDGKKLSSSQLGSAYPLHNGSEVPTINTYRKETSKKGSSKGFQTLEQTMKNLHLISTNRVTTLKGK